MEPAGGPVIEVDRDARHRTASAPIAGAARTMIGVSMAQAVAAILLYFLNQITPEPILGDVEFVTTTFVAGAIAYVGKILREHGNPFGDVI